MELIIPTPILTYLQLYSVKKIFIPILLSLFCHSLTFAQVRSTISDAHKHIGDSIIVTGTIYGGHFFGSLPDQPTILYLSDTFPQMPLLIELPGTFRNNFHPDPVEYYWNKNVTINGVVRSVKSNLEIILTDSINILVNQVDMSSHITDTSSNTPGEIESSINLDTYNNCPSIGQSTSARLQALNKSKNRYHLPSQKQFNRAVTITSILSPGNDSTRWSTSNAVEITGFVFEVKPGGDETCNCHTTDNSQLDTHIVLVSDPNKTKGSQRLIVEITPRMRFLMMQQGIDWSTANIKKIYQGHWMKVKGWLFFDDEHWPEAENTKPGNPKNWRATAWEVHPITSMELVPHN